MSTRTAITVVGTVVGAYFGSPQLGYVAGSLIGNAVDPQHVAGPQIGEIPAQTSADGVNRPLVWGTTWVYGNIIQQGPVIKIEDESDTGKGEPEQGPGDKVYRTYAVRIAGPIAGVLRVWADNKLVYDVRSGSQMLAESALWIQNKVFYNGGEDQLPDPNLVALDPGNTHAYRGTSYMVFVLEDLTDRGGSYPQYRWEVASSSAAQVWDWSWSEYTLPPGKFPTMLDVSPSGEMFTATYTTEVLASNADGTAWSVVPSTAPSGHIMVYSPSLSMWNASFGNDGAPKFSWKLDAYPGWQTAMPTSDYPPQGTWRCGCWAVDRFIAVGNPALSPSVAGCAYSLDGFHWVLTATGQGWDSVCYSPFWNRLCAVRDGIVGLSGDLGLNWTDWPTVTGFNAQDVCRSEELGIFVATGDQDFIWSIDGLTWASGAWLTPPVSQLKSIAWSAQQGMFVAAGDSNSQYFAVSTDGKNWSRQAAGVTFPLTNGHPGALKYNPSLGKFVLVMNDRVFLSNTSTISGVPVPLGTIVADIHRRCGIDASMYDTSELTALVDGFSAARNYTGADIITELRKVYFFDKSEHDKKLWYPVRGQAVAATLTIDDLTEVPETSKREQAVEVPKKLNLKYQHAASGYAPVKATFSSSSTDILTTGETSIESSVVMDENQAAQTVQKMFKIARTDIGGEMVLSVPVHIGAKLVPGNCIGVSLRGIVTRERIERMDFADGAIKLTLRPDRQSAYTSTLTGIPIPPPTLPPSTIVGSTQLAVLDIPARADSEDDLSWLVAVSGALPPWYGARYRMSLDGGANYTTIEDITSASIMGVLTADIADASEFFTDTTNVVNVQWYRSSQSVDGITDTQFLSEGGGFAIEKADGSWEVCQYRDADEEMDGSYSLSTLHRGQLNSGTSAHVAGARVVMLTKPTHVPAQSAWIGKDITHQAISLGETADDTTNEFTEAFVGRSQIEWPVEYLTLDRDGGNVITATWVPRFRFGSDANPVNSINMTGYRVTLDDGVLPAVTFDTTTPNATYDASALGSPLTVSVQPLNRITGAGPTTSGSI